MKTPKIQQTQQAWLQHQYCMRLLCIFLFFFNGSKMPPTIFLAKQPSTCHQDRQSFGRKCNSVLEPYAKTNWKSAIFISCLDPFQAFHRGHISKKNYRFDCLENCQCFILKCSDDQEKLSVLFFRMLLLGCGTVCQEK